MRPERKFSERLAEAMRLQGLSQSALAKSLATAQSTVNRWLQGSLPQPRIVRPLCAVLCVRREWLMDGRGAMEPDERERALASSAGHDLRADAEAALGEAPAHYGASAEARLLHEEIMRRLDHESLATDQDLQAALKRRIDEYIEARRARLK